MATRSNRENDVSRRNLLVGLGGGLLAAAGEIGPAYGQQSASDPQGHAEPSRMPRNHRMQADVVIVGGGMAGVCAALAAARLGVSVVLIQDRSVLGGNASSEIRMHIVGADGGRENSKTDTRETGIIEEMRLIDACSNGQRSAAMWDLMLYDMVRREPNITLLLHTHCHGVKMASADRIAAVLAQRPSTEDSFEVAGKLFIDSSGDGRLGVEAGAVFRMGRESQGEFGESLAPAIADGLVLGSSIMFQTRKHDRPMPFVAPPWVRRFAACEDLPHRGHDHWEYGFWWVEWGGQLDTIRDNEKIRDELLAAALGVWDHIKNSGRHPTSENWALEWLGFLPGKRESRRFVGDYVLKQQDVENAEVFEDGVAYGGWPIDLHPPEGIDSPEAPCMQKYGPLYNIPFRCLYSRNVSNLLFAGRNISVSHVAFGSTRVMATCAVVGQAAGTAAAMCTKRGCTPRQLGQDSIVDLQQQLLKDDAYIIGARNQDAGDLARTAEVVASSETPDGPAVNVISGVDRRVYDKLHRWVSDPGQKLPQQIELHFKEPQRIAEVHLVFDSGLQRRLTLSQSDWFSNHMTRGPQPETVSDYELLAVDGEQTRSLVKVERNLQRKRVHRFEPQTIQKLRLFVRGTHGDASARVYGIRAYA